MSYVDALTEVSTAQALTASAASTDQFDAGENTQGMGKGCPMCLEVKVNVAADSTTGNETYAFKIRTSANSDMSSSTDLTSIVIAAADLQLGDTVVVPLGNSEHSQYLDAYYTLGGTTPSVTVSSSFKPMSMVSTGSKTFYPSGYTI